MRIVDRKGWPIAPGAQVRRFSGGGVHLRGDGVVVEVFEHEGHPGGVVRYRDMRTLHVSTIPAARVEVVKKNVETRKWRRFEHAREVVRIESELATRRARRQRRVRS